MDILVDTHVHTVASGHAYSTIKELVNFASSQGMEAIAITDHTPGMPGGAHLFHFANLRSLPDYVDGIRIIRGAETNIMDYDGNIDLEAGIASILEIVIASFHPPCIDGSDEETITRALMKTIENPSVDIIGHPGDDRFPLDFERIVKHAKEHKVLLEVNNSSLKPTGTRIGARSHIEEMLKYCIEYQNPVVVASDAHFYEEVGQFNESIELLKELNFPKELVANRNLDLLMNFIRQRRS